MMNDNFRHILLMANNAIVSNGNGNDSGNADDNGDSNAKNHVDDDDNKSNNNNNNIISTNNHNSNNSNNNNNIKYHYQDDDHSDEVYDDNGEHGDDDDYDEIKSTAGTNGVDMHQEFFNFIEMLRCFEDGKFIDIKADKELQERLSKLLHSKTLASKFSRMQLLVRLIIVHLMYYDRYILIDNINKSNYCIPSTILCENYAFGKRVCRYACSLSTIGKVNKCHDQNCKQLSQSEIDDYIQLYIQKNNLLDRTLLSSSSSSSPTSSRPNKKRRKLFSLKDDQSDAIITETNDDKTEILHETITSNYSNTSSNSSFDLKALTTDPEKLFRQLNEKIKLAERSITRLNGKTEISYSINITASLTDAT